MDEGILTAIGNTPLVRLERVIKDIPFRLYAKLELLNPGGSTKDRPALAIIKQGLETGMIRSDTTIVESSSGNMGIGLAQVCAYYGLKFICVVDTKTTKQNIKMLETYGAEIDFVSDPDPVTGEYLQARIDRVRTLLQKRQNSFWPNQYTNTNNSLAHHRTMQEIVTAIGSEVDYLFCSVSTCGTMRGCAEYVRDFKMRTKVIAVDAVGSAIFDQQKARRLIPGHGASIKPELFHPELAHKCIHVTDLDCIVGCRRLVRHEAILAGGSSGGVVMAVMYALDTIPSGATCVAIFPDRGERYLDTIYADAWVRDNFGDVSHFWEDPDSERVLPMTYENA